jgi:hypothetical protein
VVSIRRKNQERGYSTTNESKCSNVPIVTLAVSAPKFIAIWQKITAIRWACVWMNLQSTRFM